MSTIDRIDELMAGGPCSRYEAAEIVRDAAQVVMDEEKANRIAEPSQAHR